MRVHRAEKLLLRTKTMTTFSSSSIFICIKQKPKVPRDEARAANFSQSLSRTLRQSKAHYSAAPEAAAAAAAAEEFFAWQPAKDCSVQLFPSTAATPTLASAPATSSQLLPCCSTFHPRCSLAQLPENLSYFSCHSLFILLVFIPVFPTFPLSLSSSCILFPLFFCFWHFGHIVSPVIDANWCVVLMEFKVAKSVKQTFLLQSSVSYITLHAKVVLNRRSIRYCY